MSITKAVVLIASLAMPGGVSLMAQTMGSPTPSPSQPDALIADAINPDRPGIADGSSVIGRGRVQIETGYQYERRREGRETERTQFLPTLLRVGLGPRWEARVEGNTFTHVSSVTGADRASGFSPISVGVKFHMRDSAGARQPSLGTLVRLFPSSGTGPFHANRTTGDLRLVADWDLSNRLSLNPNAGVAFYEDNRGQPVTAALFALTVNYFNGAKTINPFVDVGFQSPEATDGEASLTIDGGVAYLPTRDLQIDLSVGAGAHGRTPPDLFVSVGLSIRFHPSRP